MVAHMNLLAQLLSSRVRADVFRQLFGCTRPERHHREIVRQSGLSESAVRQELRRLHRLDLIRRRDDGNRSYYSANDKHPLYAAIRELVLGSVGLADLIREPLQERDIEFAFVFGSMATGTENAESDIDLMVIGDVRLRELSSILTDVAHRVTREINPHVMAKAEYLDRLASNDHFATRVLSGRKLFIIGSNDDFGALGEQRLAET